MITIIICAVIGIIIGIILAARSSWSDLFDFIMNIIFGVIIGAIIGLFIAFILPMKTYDAHGSCNIVALQDNSSVSGSFFLGSGQIDGKMKYVFYIEENGLYKMHQIDYNLVQIRYTDSIPKIHITEITKTDAFINHFAIDRNIGDQTYIIEVPKGTIKTNYNLDAQ